MNVFNIHIEFDSSVFCDTIERHIERREKAYACVVDANVITIAQRDKDYRSIVLGATINTCDGSSIAKMVNSIYGTNYRAFNGPDLFEHYIEQPYKHLLLGNTAAKVEQIKQKVREKGKKVDLQHLDVPFVSVEQFNYEEIASQINGIKPDIIWVSLGAPKQELFISKIFPYIESGVLFGIGAAFNFYTGDLHNNKTEIGGLRLIWLERICKEPRKQIKRVGRFLMSAPKMYYDERRKYHSLKSINTEK